MVSTRVSGEELEELKDLARVHFWPHDNLAGDMSEETGTRILGSGEGVWVDDVQGWRWFDFTSGAWLVNIGHGRKEIGQAVFEQMTEGVSYTPPGTVSPTTIKLVSKIASHAPDKDSRTYLVSGGSEAVETALLMAKKYHSNNGEPTRWKVVSRKGSYHGATHACRGLGGSSFASSGTDYGPPMPGNVYITNPDEYRCVYCSDKGSCNLECARELDRAIQFEGPKTVAAFIGEPISVHHGIHVPHPEYWPTIQEICHKHGVIMICDEVITGFGRTGKMFCVEHWGIKPDIMTVAKALTGGYFPIGAAIASKKVSDTFLSEESNALRHLITFGGNPPACAAGVRNLEIIEDERIVENSAKMGDYLYEQLQTMYEHPIVGNVRGGMGLLCGIDLVKDRESKEKFPGGANLRGVMARATTNQGLLGRPVVDTMRIAPALVISKDEVDDLVGRIDRAFGEAEKELGVS